MKITVIIPTYKPQDYLWECLNSLIEQTLPKNDFEIILVLNGCVEPWKNQIDNYINDKMKGININFINIERGGVSNARNVALEIASGEYITFIDDDDYVSPTYLESLLQLSTPDNIALCYPYAFIDGKADTQLESYSLTQLYNKYESNIMLPYQKVRQYFSGPCMKLFHKTIIAERYFNIHFKNGEDALYMFKISDRFKTVAFTGKDAIYYRRYRENSAYTVKKSYSYVLKNELLRICEYTKIYFSNLGKYSTRFYLTRVLGAIKSILK